MAPLSCHRSVPILCHGYLGSSVGIIGSFCGAKFLAHTGHCFTIVSALCIFLSVCLCRHFGTTIRLPYNSRPRLVHLNWAFRSGLISVLRLFFSAGHPFLHYPIIEEQMWLVLSGFHLASSCPAGKWATQTSTVVSASSWSLTSF